MKITKDIVWKEIKLLFLSLVIGIIIAFLAGNYRNSEGYQVIDEDTIPWFIIAPYLLLLVYRLFKTIIRIIHTP